MRNGFIVIALLVAELFKGFTDVNKMTCDATLWTQNDVKSQIKKRNISEDILCIELTLCTVITLVTKFHHMSIVTFPWQHNGLQALSIQKVKSQFSSFENCYCSSCSFSECEQIWTLHSTSTRTSRRKSVRLWSKK